MQHSTRLPPCYLAGEKTRLCQARPGATLGLGPRQHGTTWRFQADRQWHAAQCPSQESRWQDSIVMVRRRLITYKIYYQWTSLSKWSEMRFGWCWVPSLWEGNTVQGSRAVWRLLQMDTGHWQGRGMQAARLRRPHQHSTMAQVAKTSRKQSTRHSLGLETKKRSQNHFFQKIQHKMNLVKCTQYKQTQTSIGPKWSAATEACYQNNHTWHYSSTSVVPNARSKSLSVPFLLTDWHRSALWHSDVFRLRQRLVL